MTKNEIRQSIRLRLAQAHAARFPNPEGAVPNFVGADAAARLLSELPLWRRARVIKIATDAPLLWLRRRALTDGKVVYLSDPRLRRERCFLELDPNRLGSRCTRLANLRGAMACGRTLSCDDLRPVDLIICGSLAVTPQGARIGRGGGYGDVEYALLRTSGKIREYTPILTVVHPLQILTDRLPMRGHDIPVDFLATPGQVIAAPSLHPRPRGIIWEILREERIRAIPALGRERRVFHRTLTPTHL